MQKMFKGDSVCPYTGNAIDSPACRQCRDFFKAGTYTFIWCKHPDEPAAAPVKKKAVSVPQSERRKPGRPKKEQAKTGKRKISPNKTRKTKKR